MGTDNYTKEEREFYESIMQEIRSHKDFGKRNPVDIGIECGYSEDDVMGMIDMCQDIVGEKQTQVKPVPTRENWELEGIIPFEEFVNINFPKSRHTGNIDIDSEWSAACRHININPAAISFALSSAEDMKKMSLLEATGNNHMISSHVIHGFEDIVKWMSLYGMVAANMFNKNKIVIPITKSERESIESLIKLELETGVFNPIDKMVIEINGWDKKLKIQ